MIKQRTSRQRQLILDAVCNRCDHPTADEIYLDVREKDNRISRGTVYRNLGVLSENSQVTRVKLPQAERYDSRTDLHYHLVCTCCGKVQDLDAVVLPPQTVEQAERVSGGTVIGHQLQFFGRCTDCQAGRHGENIS